MVEIGTGLQKIDRSADRRAQGWQRERSPGRTHPEVSQPILTVVRLLLAKREIDELAVAVLRRAEWDHMLRHVREVIAGV